MSGLMITGDVVVEVLQIGDAEILYHHGYRCTPGLGRILSEEFRSYESVLVVIDRAARAHAKSLLAQLDGPTRVVPVLVDAHEQTKSLDLVNDLMEHAVGAGVNRRS